MEMIVDKYGIYISHLENLAEDKTYKPKERQTFKGWLTKWSYARIPLLCSLFLEILKPAKILSLCFQKEEVHIIYVVDMINWAKKQFKLISNKSFKELPMVKRFIEKAQQSEEENVTIYQGVKIKSFDEALTVAKHEKNQLISSVTDAMKFHLEEDNESELYNLASLILNTEGWPSSQDVESYLDNKIQRCYDLLATPLQNSSFNGTISTLLDEWHSVLDYTIKHLNPVSFDYRKVWKPVFTCSNSQNWEDFLLLAESLFCLPLSNAKVEKFFSLMNRVKTDCRASLGEPWLNNLLRICTEGPDHENFNATTSMKIWSEDVWQPNQNPSSKYKDWAKKQTLHALVDLESDGDIDMIQLDETDEEV